MGNLISQFNLVRYKVDGKCYAVSAAELAVDPVKSPPETPSYMQKLYGMNSSDIN